MNEQSSKVEEKPVKTNIIENQLDENASTFKIGQSVKSKYGKFSGVIIKITPNASAINTDMYTIRANDGKRKYVEGSFLEPDDIVVTTKIDGVDTDVIIDEALTEADFQPQFKSGDYAQHCIEGYRLQIKKFVGNKDASGQPLYEAIDDNGEKHFISETMLEPYIREQRLSPQIIDAIIQKGNEESIISKEDEIKLKTEKILRFLNITNSDDKISQLKNAMKIHKYICQNSTYQPEIMQEKEKYSIENSYFEEMYNGLINKRGVCTTDAIVFQYLLSEIGIHGDVVILESKEGGVHAATLVELGDESYYFDTTLERTIFEQYSNNPNRFVFCCAALGQEEYAQFYNPVGVLPKDLNGYLLPMPQNISKESIPKLMILSIGSEIQNLTFDENTINDELEGIEVPIKEKDSANNTINHVLQFKERKSNEEIKGNGNEADKEVLK